MGAAAVVIAAGALVSAYGKSQDDSASADQARANAKLADYAAADALARGSSEAGRITAKGSAVISEAKVAESANGLELDSPVVQNVVTTTRANNALDALTTKANAARTAWGYRQEAGQYRRAAGQSDRKSTLDLVGGGLSGLGSIAKAL